MTSIRIVDEVGEVVEREVLSRDAAVIPEDDNLERFVPSVVQRVEYDHKGQTSSLTSVCGETENRREGDNNPDITIEGIVTTDEIPQAKQLKEGQEITLVSDVHQGQVFVKSLTIEQTQDLIHYIPDESDEEQLAFTFQLQLGQPGSSTD